MGAVVQLNDFRPGTTVVANQSQNAVKIAMAGILRAFHSSGINVRDESTLEMLKMAERFLLAAAHNGKDVPDNLSTAVRWMTELAVDADSYPA
jgi:hypothetical protein